MLLHFFPILIIEMERNIFYLLYHLHKKTSVRRLQKHGKLDMFNMNVCQDGFVPMYREYQYIHNKKALNVAS
ncbi:hypothetical protein XENTR_v10008282 [Xenopus tropicalis]|nr:hypothetical protein XENTR_v10008282 [Xenopus tropicalis]